MMDATINSYKKDAYYPRVVRAVARILARSDFVAPVDVLIEMGNLKKKNFDAWRAGQVPYLERVFEGSLSKANRILRIIGFHVHDLDMVPSHASYRATSGRHEALRFSKSGAKTIEDAYSKHYKWNRSAENKRKAIEAAKPEQARCSEPGSDVLVGNRGSAAWFERPREVHIKGDLPEPLSSMEHELSLAQPGVSQRGRPSPRISGIIGRAWLRSSLGGNRRMSKLDDELQKDESLWRMWREDGVTETMPLAVDVFFHATSKEAADQIAGALRQWGLAKVEVKSTRTLWIFRGWEITGVENGTWSLNKLQDRSRRYVRLAEIWSATYDGCGALIDPDKIKPPNPQGGANGEQSLGLGANRTSSAAAPRRSL